MSVTSSDIKIYGAANHTKTDTGTQGGAISLTRIIVFDDSALANALNTTVDIKSTSASDTTQTVVVTGRLATGIIDTETFTLSGTTLQNGAVTFERIMTIVVSGTHVGDVEVYKTSAGKIATLLGTDNVVTAELEIRRLFYNATANPSGGDSKTLYEKIFIKNNHATLALLGATVAESADPTNLCEFALESTQNGSESVANRLSIPSNISGAFSGASKTIPGGNLGPGDSCGCWISLTLPDGTAAGVSTYSLQISGSSI